MMDTTNETDTRRAGDLLTDPIAHDRFSPFVWVGVTMEGPTLTWVETDAPVAGDRVSMGDFERFTGPRTTFTGRRIDGPTHVWIDLTVWGDYCGDDVTRSNHRSLLRDYSETFVDVYGDYGSSVLLLPVDQLIDADLFDTLVKLATEYPLYDEEDHWQLIDELATEAWDLYLYLDVRSDLEKRGVTDEQLEAFGDDNLRTLFYELTARQDSGPYGESADSVVFPHMEETLNAMAAEITGKA